MKKLSIFILCLSLLVGFAESQQKYSILKGKIIDVETNQPITGVRIFIKETRQETLSSEGGEFTFNLLSSRMYTVIFTHPYYETQTLSSVTILPDKSTVLEVKLKFRIPRVEEEVTVEETYFRKTEQEPVSQFTLSPVELQRVAGSFEDISRILNVLPSVAKVNDLSSDIIVRGGCPFENGFYIDNILFRTISHFHWGTETGVFSFINNEFIQDMTFYTGGFSARYGDRLSSIVDIGFREGNRERLSSTLDLNFTGFNFLMEGPGSGGNSSWLISARLFFLDFLSKATGIGVAPSFGDLHSKFVIDLSPGHKLTLLNVFSKSIFNFSLEKAIKSDLEYFLESSSIVDTGGINWQALWSDKAFSNTSISASWMKRKEDIKEVDDVMEFLSRDENEITVSFRNINFIKLNPNNKVEFGVEFSYISADYNNRFVEHLDRLGKYFPGLKVQSKLKTAKAGLFLSYIWRPFKWLSTVFGLREDYYSFNQNYHLSPRFSLSLDITKSFSISGAYGIFYQNYYPVFLARNKDNPDLKDPKAVHYILGLEFRLNESTNLTLEVYDKEYTNFPLSPEDPGAFVLDGGAALSGFYYYINLTDKGKAYSRGVEFMLQKKLVNHFYGIFSASFFRSRYKDLNGVWRNRLYDNQLILYLIWGWKPNRNWDFSFRWDFAGGIPYTPFDIELSKHADFGIIDQSLINAHRYPDYHSLSARLERRFYIGRTCISMYFNVFNCYNRKNVAQYYWGNAEEKVEVLYQTSILPIFGIRCEF